MYYWVGAVSRRASIRSIMLQSPKRRSRARRRIKVRDLEQGVPGLGSDISQDHDLLDRLPPDAKIESKLGEYYKCGRFYFVMISYDIQSQVKIAYKPSTRNAKSNSKLMEGNRLPRVQTVRPTQPPTFISKVTLEMWGRDRFRILSPQNWNRARCSERTCSAQLKHPN